jgi:hypothetical protein
MLLCLFDMRTQRQFDTKDKENERNEEKFVLKASFEEG